MTVYTNNKRINCSPWLQLQAFKQQALEKVDEVDSLLEDVVFYNVDSTAESIDQTVTGASGRVYQFTSAANSADLTISLRDINADGDGYDDNVVTKTISNYLTITDDNRDYDSVIGNGLSMSMILSDVADAKNFNQVLVEVTRSLQGSISLSLSDLTSIADQYTDKATSEIKSLLSSCRNTLHNAKVSAQGWIGILRSMFKAAEETLEDGSTYLDTEKPFVFQSVTSMLVNAGISIITTVASAILAKIAPIVGILILAVGGLITSIINKIKEASHPVQVDNSAVTNLVKGPAVYAQFTAEEREDYSIQLDQEWFSDLVSDDGVACEPFGPLLNFGFMPYERGYAYDSQYFNSYLSIQWNWRKVLTDLINTPGIVYVNQYYDNVHYNPGIYCAYLRFEVDRINKFFTDEKYYYTSDEASQVMSNPTEVLKDLYMGLILWNLLGRMTKYGSTVINGMHFVSTGSPIRTDVDVYATSANYCTNDVPTFSLHKNVQVDRFIDYRLIMPFIVHCKLFDGEVSDIDWALNYLTYNQQRMSKMHEAIQNFYTNGVTTYGKFGYRNGIYEDFSVETSSDFEDVNYGKLTTGIISDFQCWHLTTLGYEEPIIFPVDSVPPDRSIEVSGITFAQFETEIILTTAIVAAATVGTVALKKYMKNRSIIKKTTRAQNLNNLKKAYTDNPTADNAKAYTKAVKQYNLKGKLFGWGSYDAANGWFDGPSNAGSSSLSNSLLSGEDGSVLSGLNQILATGEDASGEVVSVDNISSVITLIKGV